MQNNFWNGKKKNTLPKEDVYLYILQYISKIIEKVPDEDLVFSIELVKNKIMII